MATDAQRINTLRDCLQDVFYYGRELDGLAVRAAAEPPPGTRVTGCWPDLLSDVNDALKVWSTAMDAAIVAVDDLPGHLFYKSDDPVLDRWTTKARSWLPNLPGDWLRGTYSKRHGPAAMKSSRPKSQAKYENAGPQRRNPRKS